MAATLAQHVVLFVFNLAQLAASILMVGTSQRVLRTPDQAGKLAAGMFARGYMLAFVIPLTAGAFADLFGSAGITLWLFLGINLACLPLA